MLSYSREQGIACSLYIDDPCVGEILSNKVFWARPITHRSKESSLRSTESALYIVCWEFVWLGYFLDLSKCVLQPVTQIRYLGLVIDSCQQTFRSPVDKKVTFFSASQQNVFICASYSSALPPEIYAEMHLFSLAFSRAKFYIREKSAAIELCHYNQQPNICAKIWNSGSS